MFLHTWLSNMLGIYPEYTWIVHGVIIFIVAAFIYWLQAKLLKRVHKHCLKTPHIWDDTLVRAFSVPFSVFICIFAVTLFAQFILIDFKLDSWVKGVMRFRVGATTLLFIWFFWRYIGQVEHRLAHLTKVDAHFDINTVSIVGRFLRIVVGIVAILILLESLGIPFSGVIAFGGGGAIIMGIAAQQLLANWFGGLMIFLDKPFKLGDWIQSPDRNIEGIVNRIGWRTTKVMTLDKRAMYIPNSLFNQIIIVNPQRMTHRRLNLTVGVRYDDAMKIEDMVKSIRLMLTQNLHVDQCEDVLVHLVNFGPSSLDINIYCFSRVTRHADWRDVQQDILYSVIKILNENGAEIAYPTVTTHIPDNITVRRGANV